MIHRPSKALRVNDRIVWNTVADYLPELARCIATEQSHANKKMP